jgi:hypothetical protein
MRVDKGSGTCTGEMTNAYTILIRKLESGRLKPRQKDNIEMDLKERVCAKLSVP